MSDPDHGAGGEVAATTPDHGPEVAVVMGSSSDWPTMEAAVAVLERFGVAHEALVVSAHRMPHEMIRFGTDARQRGLRAIIAGAGGAAHLPGMLAAVTTVPVLGVPVPSRHLGGEDSLLSIVQMPAGVPVATFAIGQAGATNAALFAVSLLALDRPELAHALDEYREQRRSEAASSMLPPSDGSSGGGSSGGGSSTGRSPSGESPPGSPAASPDRSS